nr:uncharacterized protein LOC106826487 [Equus asinus]
MRSLARRLPGGAWHRFHLTPSAACARRCQAKSGQLERLLGTGRERTENGAGPLVICWLSIHLCRSFCKISLEIKMLKDSFIPFVLQSFAEHLLHQRMSLKEVTKMEP